MGEVSWRVTREVEAADIKCDLCGKFADTLHFVPYVIKCEHVVFACPEHCPVPEGYWVSLERWFGEDDWTDHIGPKGNGSGWDALGLLSDRFKEIQRSLAPKERA